MEDQVSGAGSFSWFFNNSPLRHSFITIGKGSGLCSTSMYNLLGIYQRTILVARHGGKLSIGKNVGISGSTIYAMKEICIGDNTFI